MEFTLSKCTSEQIADIANIVSDSFGDLERKTGLQEDLQDRDIAEMVVTHNVHNGVIAKLNDQIIGVNFISEPEEQSIQEDSIDIRDIGPLAVSPKHQNKGVGRKLMKFVIDSVTSTIPKSCLRSLRLMGDTHNPTSFVLYSSLGFQTKGCYALLTGSPKTPLPTPPTSLQCQRMKPEDIDMICNFSKKHLGFRRKSDISNGIKDAIVLKCFEQIVGFSTGFQINRSTVATNEEYVKYMLHFVFSTNEKYNASFFINIIEYPNLLQWCISQGFRVAKSMNLMVLGEYQKPTCTYLPTVGGL